MRERMTGLARSLRKRETNSEEKLWLAIRNRQIDGWKFKRQVPRGPYVVDFLCFEAGLVIEIDGIQHETENAIVRDASRTAYLIESGLRVLRFTNSDVLDNLDGVLNEIYRLLGEQPAPSPGTLRRQKDGAFASRLLPQGTDSTAACGKDIGK